VGMASETMPAQASRDRLPAIRVPVIYGDPSMSEAFMRTDGQSAYSVIEDRREIDVRDARGILGELSLDREGFTLVDHRTDTPLSDEFLNLNKSRQDDGQPLNQRYVAEVQPLIETLTGADLVIPQTRRILIRATSRAGRVTPDPVASLVHLDYSEELAHQVVRDSCAALGRDVPAHRRMTIYQTWRTINPPPQDNTLAICDASTVSLEDSIILRTVSSGGEDKRVRLCRYNADQRWYYFRDMRPDELLVFKGYDTASPQSMTGAHVAFDPPGNEDANPRVSVEARFIAFYF
jgi:hypothetical protein